ncbi:MAG TPA: FAD-binding protein, partial [Solirubrobacteraceae bacterium]
MATEIRSPVSAQALDAALAAFSAVLGDARVITDAEGLGAFRDPFQFASWDDNAASAVLSPTTVEEIQEIVRIANRHRVPLWTHGQGRNNG